MKKLNLLFLLFLPFLTYSQNGRIFTESNSSDYSSLTSEQILRLEKIYLNYSIDDVSLVDVGILKDVQNEGRITLKVRNDGCEDVVFRARDIKYNNADDYYWYGELEKDFDSFGPICLCEEGTVTIIKKGDEVFGTIRLESRVYSINALTNNKSAIVKELDYEIDKSICGVGIHHNDENEHEVFLEEIEESAARSSQFGNCPVDVLFLVTQSSGAGLVNPENIAQNIIATANQTFRNSDILPSELTLRYVGLEEITDVNENGLSCNGVINQLRSSQQARNFRDNVYNADIVLLFANQFIANFDNVAGCAFLGPRSNSAFGVFESFGLDPLVAVHEIGHIFGCNHEPCSAINPGGNCLNPEDPFRQAHTFIDLVHVAVPCRSGFDREVERRTVMYSEISNLVIPNFSNPDVFYEQEATGVELDRDNALWLKESACEVANFRQTPTNPLSVNIIVGPKNENCSGSDLTLFADINGGCPGVWTWQWFKSNDGINYTHLPQYDNVLNILDASFEGNPGDVTFYRVEVTSSCNNQTAIGFTQVYTIETCTQYFTSNDKGNEFLKAYPNPTSTNSISLDYTIKEISDVSVEFINLNGESIKKVDLGKHNAGNYTYRTQFPENSSNLLFLKLKKGQEIETVKIMYHE